MYIHVQHDIILDFLYFELSWRKLISQFLKYMKRLLKYC